jgi:hypothetical protein
VVVVVAMMIMVVVVVGSGGDGSGDVAMIAVGRCWWLWRRKKIKEAKAHISEGPNRPVGLVAKCRS